QVELRTEAAGGDLGALAVTPLDRDAGDALQGLREVGIRELADVLGADRVDDARRVALDVHRLVQRAAQAGDLHGVQLGGLLRILRERGIDHDHAADDGEHRPRAELLLQLVAHQGVLSTGGLSGTGGHRWRVRAACGRGHAQRQRWTWKACTSCKTSISLRTFEWVFPYAQGFPDGAFGGLRSMQ